MNPVVKAGVFVLEALFVVGWAGSLIVVIVSGIEDLEVIFKPDSPDEKHEPVAG